jgi:hypothetical protein
VSFDPKLTFNKHIENTEDKAKKTLNVIKQLTGTDCGKNKETLTATYEAYTRPILEYTSPVWSSIVRKTNMNKLQTVQNKALRTATGQIKDTNTQYLHDETLVLPLYTHTKLLASQLREKATVDTHPLHRLTNRVKPPRTMKKTIFNLNYTTNIQKCANNPKTQTEQETRRNMKTIHTEITANYMLNRTPNTVLGRQAPIVNNSEETLTRKQRRTLDQLRAGKSSMLQTYMHKINPLQAPSPNCLLYNQGEHDTRHLFECRRMPTHLIPEDL